MLVGFLGCLKAGHPYVPLDAGLPSHRIRRIVETARAALVLTPAEIGDIAPSWALPDSRAARPSDLHYIMFTSGSTGEPKGVPITGANLAHFLEWMRAEHRLEPGETFLNQALFSFDLSVMDTYLGLVTGGTVVSLSREEIENPRQLFRRLSESEVSVWVSTPTFAQMCLVERRFDHRMLPRLRRFLFCGETLAPKTAASLLDRFPEAEVWNTYGPTEATVATTSVRIDRAILDRYSVLPVGYPMRGSRVVVADEQLRPKPEWERGEIVIAGPNVSPGYLHRPDLTARAFTTLDGASAFRTGDWGHTEDGLLFCDGRMDDQIKLHGYRIELGDVEGNLSALPGVLGAAVLPVVKNGAAESLTAYLVLAAPPTVPESEVTAVFKTKLGERLPSYMVPRRFRYLEAFPMTPNGKVDRRTLAELDS